MLEYIRNKTKVSTEHSKNGEYQKFEYVTKFLLKLNCGFVSGLIQSALFNPWDRALYLSVKEERAFLHPQNFVRPFTGVFQALLQRAVSAGLYFPLEEMNAEIISLFFAKEFHDEKKYIIYCLAGVVAGAINGILMNPIASIKYHYWGKTDFGKENAFLTASEMYRKGGIRTFLVGSFATVTRDVIFGGSFALLRNEIFSVNSKKQQNSDSDKQFQHNNHDFIVNLISASFATILSSPFNYVRNMHYATPPDQTPLSVYTILTQLIKQANNEPTQTKKLNFVFKRLRIGWGTARVGCGMALAAKMYSFCSQIATTSE